MRVTSQNGSVMDLGIESPALDKLAPIETVTVSIVAQEPALQSAVFQSAQAALDEMPEIDMDKVEMLKQGLANGEIKFDADRLADLIQRFHGDGA